MLDLVRFEANVVQEIARTPRMVRFGAFEVDLRAGELSKNGAKLKLTGQPFQVLTILLEQPGEVVTREHNIGIADIDPDPQNNFDGLLGFAKMGFRKVSFDFENGLFGWE